MELKEVPNHVYMSLAFISAAIAGVFYYNNKDIYAYYSIGIGVFFAILCIVFSLKQSHDRKQIIKRLNNLSSGQKRLLAEDALDIALGDVKKDRIITTDEYDAEANLLEHDKVLILLRVLSNKQNQFKISDYAVSYIAKHIDIFKSIE